MEVRPRSWAWMWIWAAQCWLLWVLGPRLYRGHWSAGELLWTAVPPMILGVLALRSRGGHPPSPTLALTLFPASLAMSVAALDAQQALATYSSPLLIAGGISLLAFSASASATEACHGSVRDTHVQPLGASHVATTDPRRGTQQMILIAGVGLPLLALILIGSQETALHYHEAWGDTAAAGATLTAIVAGLLGSIAMAGIVGPAMRAERTTGGRAPQEAWRRVGWLAAVALSGLLTYGLLLTD